MKPQFQQFNLRANCCRRHARSSICDSTARLSPSPNGHALLFQKFVRLAAQRLGDTDHAGQRKIVFAAFNAADERPVHVRAFSERFLRQGHFFPIRAHVLCQSLAILVFHARQVWKKKAPSNIDVTTIAFDTRQPLRTLADSGLPIPAEPPKLRPGVSHTKPDSELPVFPKRHRNKSGRNGDSCRKILRSDESGDSSHAADAKGEPTSKR